MQCRSKAINVGKLGNGLNDSAMWHYEIHDMLYTAAITIQHFSDFSMSD